MDRQENPTGWPALAAEFDAWAASGRQADLWWRDDDATRPGPALDRLLNTAGETPLGLAVIPESARDSLAGRLRDHISEGGSAVALQHGYAHRNHAPAGEKHTEYGPHRPLEEMLAELEAGRRRMETLFADLFAPVLVPPWNRLSDTLAPRLAESGLTGLSRFGARAAGEGQSVVNTHVDIVNWRGGRDFVGEAAALDMLIGHLAARRAGKAEAAEPTGILTHHRDHDEACWNFLDRLVGAVRSHPAACWTSAAAPDAR